MKHLKIVDGPIHYHVLLVPDEAGTGLEFHSCWRFYPGRTLGEQTNLGALPWPARQQIAEEVNDRLP